MKIDLTRIASCYLSDMSPDNNIIDEAIATIEAVFENKTDEELYECERPLMIAYLALRIVKAGLNVYPQKDEVHGHWIEELGDVISCRCSRCDHSYNLYEDDINGYPYCAWCGAKMDEDESEDGEP